MIPNCTHPVMDGENLGDNCSVCGAVISQEVALAAHVREQEIRQPKCRGLIVQDFFTNMSNTKRLFA